MAESFLTPEQVAIEVMIHNPGVDPDVIAAIREVQSLYEAIIIVEGRGLDMTGSTVYTAARERAQVEQGRVGSPHTEPGVSERDRLEAMKPEGWIPRGEQLDYWVEHGIIDEEQATVLAGLAAADDIQNQIDETPLSPMLTLSLPGGPPPDPAAHHAMIWSDDYSPWGTRGASRVEAALLTIKAGPEVAAGAPPKEIWDQYITRGEYVSGQELIAYSQLSPESRSRIEGKMVSAGLLDTEDEVLGYHPGSMGLPQLSAMRQAMAYGTDLGIGYEVALDRMTVEYQAMQRLEDFRDSRVAGSRPSFSVPASLREIPDYESLSQEVHNLFRQRLGRDAEDWELGVLADEMQTQYRNANAEKIKAAKAAFYQAQGGRSGVMEVEVPDPVLRSQRFIEERYGPEIDRHSQIDDTSTTNRLMIDAITRGAGMVGG